MILMQPQKPMNVLRSREWLRSRNSWIARKEKGFGRRSCDEQPASDDSGEQTANMLRFSTWFFERARLQSEIFETLSTP